MHIDLPPSFPPTRYPSARLRGPAPSSTSQHHSRSAHSAPSTPPRDLASSLSFDFDDPPGKHGRPPSSRQDGGSGGVGGGGSSLAPGQQAQEERELQESISRYAYALDRPGGGAGAEQREGGRGVPAGRGGGAAPSLLFENGYTQASHAFSFD